MANAQTQSDREKYSSTIRMIPPWASEGQTTAANRAEAPRGSASPNRLPQPSFHERGRALQALHERNRSHSPNAPFPARERGPWLPWTDSKREAKKEKKKMVDVS
ncbi:hypothetical protein N7449_007734 [Penicillium cf. viridicatum]|uniref:Uncharacterized protein n=1 Tax=Penicillium cf. viridicatum TaxID=2972119 RepID=A0A9W9JHV6_9EURO|nr:hypothetical protein N7449_007734 [Penicillium cf. viridicatum]